MSKYVYVKWTNPQTGKTVTTHTDNPQRAVHNIVEKYGGTNIKVYSGVNKPKKHIGTYTSKRTYSDDEQIERLDVIGVQTPDSPPYKRFEGAVRSGALEGVPVSMYKHYEGGAEYLKSLTLRERKEIVTEYLDTHDPSEITDKPYRVKHDVGRALFPQSYKDVTLGAGSKYERYSERNLRQGAWEELTELESGLEEKYWNKLPSPAKWTYSYSNAFVTGMTFPITLAQAGVKYITGEGDLTDPIGRIGSGKTFLPDVSHALGKAQGSQAPSGLVGTAVSEGVGVLTGKSPGLWERFQRDPVSGLFATGGEIFGIVLGGKGVHVGKTATVRGFGIVRKGLVARTGWQLPDYTFFVKYSPKNILRTGYWKAKEKLGYSKYISEKPVWDDAVIAGYKKFAEQQGASKQLQLFEATRPLSDAGDILGIHASGSRSGLLKYIGKGGHESPGLSVSSFGRGSPYFLRVTGQNLSYDTGGISLFPRLHTPTAPIFHLKNVLRLPKGLRGASYDKTSKFILDQPKGPYAWISPKSEIGGPEIEAVIRAGTIGKRFSNYYYTSYKGVTIPLPQYKLFGNVPSGFSRGFVSSKVKDFFSVSYSSGSPSLSIFNPSYLLSRASSVSSSSFSSSSSLSVLSRKSFPSFNSIISSGSSSSFGSFKSPSLSSKKSSSLSSLSKSVFSLPSSVSKPSPSSYNIYFTPPPPKPLIVDDYPTKRKVVDVFPKNLFGKGWRKRTWFKNNLEVI